MTDRTTGTPRPVAIRRRVWRLPRWFRAIIGVAAVVLGTVVVFRPTMSLGLLALLIGAGLVLVGILRVAGGDEAEEAASGAAPSRWRSSTGVLWILAGVLVLTWLGLTVRALAIVVGAALIVDGVVSIASAFSKGRTLDARIAAIAIGVASVVFGALALIWPDIALIIVGVVFGARLIVTGLVTLWWAIRGDAPAPNHADLRPSAPRRWMRTIVAIAAVVLAVAAAGVSASIRGASPIVDEFYAAPRTVPPEPGRLIRSEPYSREVPADALGWRILYTTTDGAGDPAVASGLVVVPREGGGDWPVIDWTHGTTGFAQDCAPSLRAEPFESGALMVLPDILENGWALVAADYVGLGTVGPHPYLVGIPTAHATLDAVRAARELADARLSEQTVVWGHSQGGGGALWVGAVADEYAPDVELAGIAALAPASNLIGLVQNLPNVPGGSIFASYVVAAYSALYDDVHTGDYLRPGAEVTVRELAERCLSDPGTYVSLLDMLGLSRDPALFRTDPTTGAFGERLAENTPPATITAPLLLGQGAADPLVLPSAQDAYVRSLCAAGVDVDYRRYAGLDHLSLVAADSRLVPELIEWTHRRLAGDPVVQECTRTEQ